MEVSRRNRKFAELSRAVYGNPGVVSRGRWEPTIPMAMLNYPHYDGYGTSEELSELAGGIVGASEDLHHSTAHAITVGIAVGVAVHVAARLVDHIMDGFLGRGK